MAWWTCSPHTVSGQAESLFCRQCWILRSSCKDEARNRARRSSRSSVNSETLKQGCYHAPLAFPATREGMCSNAQGRLGFAAATNALDQPRERLPLKSWLPYQMMQQHEPPLQQDDPHKHLQFDPTGSARAALLRALHPAFIVRLLLFIVC